MSLRPTDPLQVQISRILSAFGDPYIYKRKLILAIFVITDKIVLAMKEKQISGVWEVRI